MDFTRDVRRYFHRYPELSGFEFQTKEKVKEIFIDHSLCDEFVELGKTGIAFIKRGAKKGKRIMFRCELDALPITEINEFDYASTIAGVSHKCGHDGHMATMIDLAFRFKELPPQEGEVVFLFQPAEENGNGALEVLNDNRFKPIEPDMIIAWHNIPGEMMGKFLLKDYAFTPDVISLKVNFTGRTSHAAEPLNGNNPVYSIMKVIDQLNKFSVDDLNSKRFCRIAIVKVLVGGDSYGTSAGSGELGLTIRTQAKDFLREVQREIEKTVKAVCLESGVSYSMEWFEFFAANRNDPEIISGVEEFCQNNHIPFLRMDNPFPWGEDFGHFTNSYRGAMLGVGAGMNTPPLHAPDYDFPDELIDYVSEKLHTWYFSLQLEQA